MEMRKTAITPLWVAFKKPGIKLTFITIEKVTKTKRRNEAPEQKAAQLAAALNPPLYSGRPDNAL